MQVQCIVAMHTLVQGMDSYYHIIWNAEEMRAHWLIAKDLFIVILALTPGVEL